MPSLCVYMSCSLKKYRLSLNKFPDIILIMYFCNQKYERTFGAELTIITNLTNLLPINFEYKRLKRLCRLVIIVSKKAACC